ncbi:hypothetical protein GCM10023185_24970 [Hymenobacter saemangeumensis]|uniref:SMP domain-containing protein n=1 Tax=Hymenobacter saemangeumensis TaxID=1084522 RepID=A0ABP8IHD6_9BACT
MAQAPTAAQATNPSAQRKQEAQDRRNGQGTGSAAADNHGQTVQAFATSTPLTGAAKGAAISEVARSRRSTAQGQRPAHSARSARGGRSMGHAHAASPGHQGGRPAGVGRR